MPTAVDDFVARAREAGLAEAAERLGLKMRPRAQEHPQPCPACGGKDTFAFNTSKKAWNCRKGGAGGHDAIGMAAHVAGLELSRRDGFLEACSAVLAEPIPEGGERESEADRAARLARLDAQREKWLEEQAAQEAEAADYRERERAKARGKFEAGAAIAGTPVEAYLRARLGSLPAVGSGLRFLGAEPYWHPSASSGRTEILHEGPAMVAPFVDAPGLIIGCHLTWIDLGRAPKFRPVLADPATGEVLPAKKMRGTKKGGLIPLIGFVRDGDRIIASPGRRRMLVGEGIETVLAVALCDGMRRDTIYAAAGDLGNMAGPAEASSRFAHPSLTATDRAGRVRRLMVAGPVPKAGQGPDEAFAVPAHVEQLVLLGDGDSERVMTAAALARAKARVRRPGLVTVVAMAREGYDFTDLLQRDLRGAA